MELITVSMLYHSKHPRHVTKAYICAAVADMEGIQYISPGKVRFEDKKTLGSLAETDVYRKLKVCFPLPVSPSATKFVRSHQRIGTSHARALDQFRKIVVKLLEGRQGQKVIFYRQ